MTRNIIRKLTIDEISLVDKPANKLARIAIAKRDDTGDTMSTKFGKAAEAEWDEALTAYAARHRLSKSAATLEFANTAEANDIYKRTRQTPRAENIAKAAAIGNVSLEILAKTAFPDVHCLRRWSNISERRTAEKRMPTSSMQKRARSRGFEFRHSALLRSRDWTRRRCPQQRKSCLILSVRNLVGQPPPCLNAAGDFKEAIDDQSNSRNGAARALR